MPRDLGDFQTPQSLVDEVITCLLRTGRRWTRVLEPTCGQGNFIKGLLKIDIPPQEIQGIEIQHKHILSAQESIQDQKSSRITIKQANIFDVDLQADLKWQENGPLLVLGNPPWITNTALSTLESKNVPVKTNFKGLSGLGAMTGESNFDIAEYIFLKLAKELMSENPTIALLCKTSVARNILKFAYDTNIPTRETCIWKINSKKSFGTDVDACLFYLDLRPGNFYYQTHVYQNLNVIEPSTTIGIINNHLVSDVSTNKHLAFIDNICPLTWRQGLKHDAAAIFELRYDSSGYLYNKFGEIVQVEQEYVYPLLKSSDLGGKDQARPQKAVLVTQKYIGEDTYLLKEYAPLLWKYLNSHGDICAARKSSIYENQPPFAIFGIGDYSFSPYKVAISGMYKTIKFSAVGPVNGRPMQFDDTCYLIACRSAEQAAFVSTLLNHPLCLDFINSIVFWDAKRPITKKLLQRIDLKALLKSTNEYFLIEQTKNVLRSIEPSKDVNAIKWPENLEVFFNNYSSHAEIVDSATPTKTGKLAQGRLF